MQQIDSKSRSSRTHAVVLVLCLLPALAMFAAVAINIHFGYRWSLFWTGIPQHPTLLDQFEQYGRQVAGLFGLLAIPVAFFYPLIRFRSMTWRYSLGFAIVIILTVFGLLGALIFWGRGFP
jgi:hypothetical protein